MKPTEFVKFIKEQIGISLELCPDFPGTNYFWNGHYFSIVFADRLSESSEYDKVLSYSKKTGDFSIEPNGVRRAAIIFKS